LDLTFNWNLSTDYHHSNHEWNSKSHDIRNQTMEPLQ